MNGGFLGTFVLTTVKVVNDMDLAFMINPIYNLHWFKELSNTNYTNWVGGFDWVQEEWTNNPHYYISQALDIYPVVKYYTIRDPNIIINPQSGLNWFKECQDNYQYKVGYWDNMTVGDPPLNTNNQDFLSRKKVNDDTLVMEEALDAEIQIII